MNTKVYVESIRPFVRTLGPGTRICVWVQGCSLHCPGCLSPELSEQKESSAREIGEVLRNIMALSPGHDGITISGGEPFEQAGPLALAANVIRRKTDLDILVYSGHTIEEIRQGCPEMQSLLSSIDVLIDGRYEMGTSNRKLWRGSDNQRMHLLTERAQRYAEFVNTRYKGRRPVQIETTADGKLRVIGIPSRGFVLSLRQRAGKRGLSL